MIIRGLVVLVVLLLAGYGGLTLYYGSGDPCRMLAKEQDTPLDQLRRTFAEKPTTRECVDELWREWFDK
jgi:hypothetical protein